MHRNTVIRFTEVSNEENKARAFSCAAGLFIDEFKAENVTHPSFGEIPIECQLELAVWRHEANRDCKLTYHEGAV